MEGIRFNDLSYEPDNVAQCCIVCGSPYAQHHHIFGGTARRKISDKYGFIVPLCWKHHTGKDGVHHNREMDVELKQAAQTYYEQHYGTREDFIKEFGKSWIK